MELHQVLIKPVFTEKTMRAQEQAIKSYTFIVHPDANKIEIRKAVETIYQAKVEEIRIIPVRAKVRNINRSKTITTRQSAKKAMVTLKKGETMDVMKTGGEEAPKKKTSAKKTSTKK